MLEYAGFASVLAMPRACCRRNPTRGSCPSALQQHAFRQLLRHNDLSALTCSMPMCCFAVVCSIVSVSVKGLCGRSRLDQDLPKSKRSVLMTHDGGTSSRRRTSNEILVPVPNSVQPTPEEWNASVLRAHVHVPPAKKLYADKSARHSRIVSHDASSSEIETIWAPRRRQLAISRMRVKDVRVSR